MLQYGGSYPGSGYLNNLSINRPDRMIRSAATYVRLVGLVQPGFIQVPRLRISTLNPSAKLRAGIERRTLNGLTPLLIVRSASRLSFSTNLQVCSIAQIRNCHRGTGGSISARERTVPGISVTVTCRSALRRQPPAAVGDERRENFHDQRDQCHHDISRGYRELLLELKFGIEKFF